MMARVVSLIDDRDGSDEATTIKWSYKGVQHTIDLAAHNEAEMDADMQKWIDIADAAKEEATATRAPMKQPKAVKTSGRRKSKARPSEEATQQELREFGRNKGFEVSDRGRVKDEVKDAYDAAVEAGELELADAG